MDHTPPHYCLDAILTENGFINKDGHNVKSYKVSKEDVEAYNSKLNSSKEEISNEKFLEEIVAFVEEAKEAGVVFSEEEIEETPVEEVVSEETVVEEIAPSKKKKKK